ncbi:HicB family protein [Alicyclobacillus contaminans]|uniref:type II toxin-antitoxin system HicB family antitoxin n=1 Tax=Alicyclobacillus contaminans TaxID=392016 RepID=UPI0003F79882|nr:type II toxin-antitoxin system HicB family antitoxin [Alicyclobacillus contaminans]GMA49898.1 HicB family protein [Alicyclobacillus contaminans]
MDRYTFPAVFEPDENGNGYTVTFPDLPGCITEGDTLEEAKGMAQEALEGYLWEAEQHHDPIPEPSRPETLQLDPGTFIVPIDAWMDLVRDEMANKVVRTNVTLPKWLKDAAEERKINFSQLLQQAIKERLGIQNKTP